MLDNHSTNQATPQVLHLNYSIFPGKVWCFRIDITPFIRLGTYNRFVRPFVSPVPATVMEELPISWSHTTLQKKPETLWPGLCHQMWKVCSSSCLMGATLARVAPIQSTKLMSRFNPSVQQWRTWSVIMGRNSHDQINVIMREWVLPRSGKSALESFRQVSCFCCEISFGHSEKDGPERRASGLSELEEGADCCPKRELCSLRISLCFPSRPLSSRASWSSCLTHSQRFEAAEDLHQKQADAVGCSQTSRTMSQHRPSELPSLRWSVTATENRPSHLKVVFYAQHQALVLMCRKEQVSGHPLTGPVVSSWFSITVTKYLG